MSAAPTIHASCVVVGEAGMLIRGPSGAGKSSLAIALIERAATEGIFGRLVADDRVHLTAAHGRVIAAAPAALAGLIERRGLGVTPAPSLRRAVVRLVVDLGAAERLPEPESLVTTLAGMQLPRVAVSWDRPEAVSLVLARLRTCFSQEACCPCALAFATQHGKMFPSAPHAPPFRSDRAGVARGGHDLERNQLCAETA